MGSDAMAAVEAPEHTIHLQHINRLLLAFKGDRVHQHRHLGLVEGPLQRAPDRSKGQHGLTHGSNS